MEFRIWVETRLAGHIIERQLVAQVERPTIAPEEIGLSLEEGKTVLQQVQACMIQAQAEVLGAALQRTRGRNWSIQYFSGTNFLPSNAASSSYAPFVDRFGIFTFSRGAFP